MKSHILNLLSNIKILNNLYSGIGTIFMLHRVSDFEENKLFPNENLKVSPKYLDEFIYNLKSSGFLFVSIDELIQNLLLGKEVSNQIVFTLDDGYLDNYHNAYPIFKKHNVPFTVYICSGLVDKSITAWWHDSENIITQNDSIIFDKKKIICKTNKDKISAFFQIRNKLLNVSIADFNSIMSSFHADNNFIPNKINPNLFMDWDHVHKISQDSLVTIGSHTKSHFSLKNLNKKEIVNEILSSNSIIENNINVKVRHFAFPYGSRNEVGLNEIEQVRNLGFKSVVTTRSGNIFKEHASITHSLPRIMLTEKFNVTQIGRIRSKRIITI